MKKLFFLLLIVGLSGTIKAQQSQDEILQEMQRLQQQLMEQFQSFDDLSQGFPLFSDSLFMGGNGFHMQIDTSFQWGMNDPSFFIAPDQMQGLMEQFQQGLSQMTDEDWAELEKMFRQFSLPLPDPNQVPQEEMPNKPRKDGRKKPKIYNL